MAWYRVCKPKMQGGIGILDVNLHNKALMMKCGKINKDPLPWVQLIWEKYYSHSLPESKLEGSSWWKSHLKLLVEYNKSSVCKLGNGQATLLWHDNWLDQPLKERFPELLSFAKSDSLYVHDWNRTEDQIQLFHTPLSTQAYNQFTQMQNLI